MRRPASVKENSGFCRVFLPPSLPTSGRRVPPLFAMFFLLRRVLEKPVPCVRFLVKRHVPAFGRSSALRFPPLAPLPSALWMGRIRPGASWGPSFPSRCCYLGDGLEDQDADRSHPDAAVGGELRRQTESLSPLVPPKYLLLRSAVSHPQLPSRLCRGSCRRLAVAQRLVHLAGHQQSVQQYRQLPRHRHDGALLRVLASPRCQP